MQVEFVKFACCIRRYNAEKTYVTSAACIISVNAVCLSNYLLITGHQKATSFDSCLGFRNRFSEVMA